MVAQVSYVGKQYENGNIHYTGSLSGSEETGLWKFYHENGQLESVGYYAKGKRVGEWRFYDENGNLESVGTYVNGKKGGDWKYYDAQGTLRDNASALGNYAEADIAPVSLESELDQMQSRVKSTISVDQVGAVSPQAVNRQEQTFDRETFLDDSSAFVSTPTSGGAAGTIDSEDLKRQLAEKENALQNELHMHHT